MKTKLTFLITLLAANAWAQLGSVTVQKTPYASGCPTGFTCQLLEVNVPGTPMIHAIVATREPSGQLSADSTFFLGHNGNGWWQGPGVTPSAMVQSFFNDLSNAGVRLIQVRWCNLWSYSLFNGFPVYIRANSARSATLLSWIKQQFPAPKFDVVGGSWGSGEVAYVLSGFPQVQIDLAVVHSGPVEFDIADGCEQPTGYLSYFGDSNAVDQFFQGTNVFGSGPCYQHDVSLDSIWRTNSVEYGGVYSYANTDVHVLYGLKDATDITRRAVAYYNFLLSNGQPTLEITPVANCAHEAIICEPYLQAIESVLLGQ